MTPRTQPTAQTAGQAIQRPVAKAHNIWEIVLHMTTWKRVVRERIEGQVRDIPREEAWPRLGDTSDSDWESAINALVEAHRRLYDVVAQLDETRLSDKPGPESNTYYVQVHGIIQHDLYHAGQIALLKKSFVRSHSAAGREPRPVVQILRKPALRTPPPKEPPPAPAPVPAPAKEERKTAGAMSIRSSAFADGKRIPKEYTCDGANLSPPLAWSGVPKGTKNLALICDDPDAPMGAFTHWVLWGLAPDATSLEEGVHLDTHLPGGARQGRGRRHRYERRVARPTRRLRVLHASLSALFREKRRTRNCSCFSAVLTRRLIRLRRNNVH